VLAEEEDDEERVREEHVGEDHVALNVLEAD